MLLTDDDDDDGGVGGGDCLVRVALRSLLALSSAVIGSPQCKT